MFLPFNKTPLLYTASHSNPCPWPWNFLIPPTKTEYISKALDLRLIHVTSLAGKCHQMREWLAYWTCLLGFALLCFCWRNRKEEYSCPAHWCKEGEKNMEQPSATCTWSCPSWFADTWEIRAYHFMPSRFQWLFTSGCLFPDPVENLSKCYMYSFTSVNSSTCRVETILCISIIQLLYNYIISLIYCR